MRFNTKGTCIYFEVNDSETLSKIDDFLRDLWLECCGHLSLLCCSIQINAIIYNFHKDKGHNEELLENL